MFAVKVRDVESSLHFVQELVGWKGLTKDEIMRAVDCFQWWA